MVKQDFLARQVAAVNKGTQDQLELKDYQEDLEAMAIQAFLVKLVSLDLPVTLASKVIQELQEQSVCLGFKALMEDQVFLVLLETLVLQASLERQDRKGLQALQDKMAFQEQQVT